VQCRAARPDRARLECERDRATRALREGGVDGAGAATAKREIGGLSAVVLWTMGVLGGSFIPVFLLDRLLGPVPKIVPHYWANRALTNVMLRGLRLADVRVELAALAAFAALFFVVGLLRFDFD